MEFKHISVLLNESVDMLNIKADGVYVDGTLGGGGHSELIVKNLSDGLLIGIDQDKNAIEAATKRLMPYKDKVITVHDNFSNIKNILKEQNIPCQMHTVSHQWQLYIHRIWQPACYTQEEAGRFPCNPF